MKSPDEKLTHIFDKVDWAKSNLDAEAIDYMNTIKGEIVQMAEDIDFLCTWCSYSTMDKYDAHLRHHQEIIKRWKESNE